MNKEIAVWGAPYTCTEPVNGIARCYETITQVEYKEKEWTTTQTVQWFAGALFYALVIAAVLVWISDLISKVYETHNRSVSVEAQVATLNYAVGELQQPKKGRRK